MDAAPREIVMLETDDGHVPFEEWFNGLRDKSFQRSIDARLTRVADGNFGNHRSVGEGVFELKIPQGPGLRVYYGLDGPHIVVLIGGGDKRTQKKDIKKARELWRKYLNAK